MASHLLGVIASVYHVLDAGCYWRKFIVGHERLKTAGKGRYEKGLNSLARSSALLPGSASIDV